MVYTEYSKDAVRPHNPTLLYWQLEHVERQSHAHINVTDCLHDLFNSHSVMILHVVSDRFDKGAGLSVFILSCHRDGLYTLCSADCILRGMAHCAATLRSQLTQPSVHHLQEQLLLPVFACTRLSAHHACTGGSRCCAADTYVHSRVTSYCVEAPPRCVWSQEAASAAVADAAEHIA
eukprot:6419-Heterococcus_DN1.PRE.3